MDQVEEVRSKIDLVQLINEYVPLTKAGRNFKGVCPFHSEKTPSFIVSPERQIWHCFGCQKGGDAYRFLMELERIEFGEALRLLAKKAGVTLKSYRPSEGESEKEALIVVNNLAAEFYHWLLVSHKSGKRALEYVLARGITKESIEKFKIGYAPDMWDGVQKFLIQKKSFDLKTLEKAGLILESSRKGNYYDRFRNRLMFPLSDHRGNIVGFAGRLLDPNAKEAKYINTPETVLYHKSELLYPLNITKEEIKRENTAVLVEGEIDAISSYQAGVMNVVAIKGSALTDHQSRLLKRFCENIVIALDSDSAGNMAAKRGIEVAEKCGLNLRIVELEGYKDPDEAAQKDPGYWRKKVHEAVGAYDFLIDYAFKNWRGITSEEKRKIGQELIPIFAKIEDEIVKDVAIKKLAARLGVNEESVIIQLEKIRKPVQEQTTVRKEAAKMTASRREVLEEYLLALLLQAKKVEEACQEGTMELFKVPINAKMAKLVAEYVEKNGKFSSQFFFRDLPAELQEAFNKYYIVQLGDKVDDSEWVGKEIGDTRKRIRVMGVREDLMKATEEYKVDLSDENADKIRKLTVLLADLEKEP